MDYDKILLKIGHFGRWQKKSLLFLLVPVFVAGFVAMTTTFTTGIPREISCNIRCHNFVTPNGNPISRKQTYSLLSPLCNSSSMDILRKPDYCTVVQFTRVGNISCSLDTRSPVKEKYVCDENSDYYWNKEDLVMKSTVLTDHNAYCMRGVDLYKEICRTLQQVGILFGWPFFGTVADTFGRKTSITMAIFFTFIGSFLGLIASNPWVYAVTRIIPGAGGIGAQWMAFILVVEILGKKGQVHGVPWNLTIFSLVASIFAVPMFLCVAINGLIAYICQHWWSYQLAVTTLCALGCWVWVLIPESPRWLIEQKKFDEVKKLVKYASNINNKEIENGDLEIFESLDNESEIETWSIVTATLDQTYFETLKHGAEDVWSGKKGLFHPVLRRTTIILFILWVFSSISQYVDVLIGEESLLLYTDYLKVGVYDLVEFSSYIIVALTIDLLGRKPIITWSFFVAAISLFGAAFYGDDDDTAKILVYIAVFHLNAGATVVRIFSTETYPTSLRVSALLSFKSVTSLVTLANIWIFVLRPETRTTGYFGKMNSCIFFGVLSCVSSILSLMLADTVGFPLPNTLRDVHKIKLFQKPFFQIARKNWNPIENK